MSLKDKKKLADYVIVNNSSIEKYLEKYIKEDYKILKIKISAFSSMFNDKNIDSDVTEVIEDINNQNIIEILNNRLKHYKERDLIIKYIEFELYKDLITKYEYKSFIPKCGSDSSDTIGKYFIWMGLGNLS